MKPVMKRLKRAKPSLGRSLIANTPTENVAKAEAAESPNPAPSPSKGLSISFENRISVGDLLGPTKQSLVIPSAEQLW